LIINILKNYSFVFKIMQFNGVNSIQINDNQIFSTLCVIYRLREGVFLVRCGCFTTRLLLKITED
jgi:hypothetical protein